MSEIECPVHAAACLNPEAVALEWPAGKLSYRELDSLIEAVGRNLKSSGISSGDRVGILSSNSWQYIVLVWALFRMRALVVPYSTRFPLTTIQQLIDDLKCEVLLVEQHSALKGKQVAIQGLVSMKFELEISDSLSLLEEQPATVMFSSGSTGLPKAILHAWGNHYYNALGSNSNIKMAVGDRWMLSLPLYHVAGMAVLFRCFLAGATIVVADPRSNLAKEIYDKHITHISLVSAQLLQLVESFREGAYDSLKHVLVGGSSLPQALIREAVERQLPIHTTYGMTEMGSQVTTTGSGSSLESLFTSGCVLPYREVQFDQDGQIFVKGRTCFQGYLLSSGLKIPFDEKGYFATGDLGRIDEEGRLHVLGRKDNMFISGGENIHPEEIERALESLGGIKRAYVVPVPDKIFGFRPFAFVEVSGTWPAINALEIQLAQKIARFMLPIRYYDLTKADAQEGMKISRETLKRMAAELMKELN